MIAASVTVRVIGPAVSCEWAIGMIPSCGTRPRVGLSPTTPLLPAGHRIEPSVSLPTVAEHRFAAAATADPELDPHGSQSRTYGFRVKLSSGGPAVGEARRDEAAEVGPLGQVRLAEDDRPGAPQRRDHRRVRGHLAPDEGQGTGRRLHAVGRRDVVLDDDRDPVKRTAEPPALSLGVSLGGDAQGLGVRLDDRAEQWVEPADPAQIRLRERQAGQLA